MSVDLKILTPDASINDSAVLFGADSQASASPSVYAVSTLRTHIANTANTFTQPQIVSVNSSSNAFRITQTGAGNALLVEDSANPDSTPFVVDANGVVGIGEASPGSYLSGGMVLRSSGAFLPQILAWNTTNGTSAPYWNTRKDRAGAIVNNGDALGTFVFQGYDGAAYRDAALINVNVDGTPGASDMPGRIGFWTTLDGASSPTERMRINNAGAVLIGTTTATGNVISTGNTHSSTGSITNQYHQYNSSATSGSGTKTGSNLLMVPLAAYAGTGAWIAYNGNMTSQSPNTVSQFRAFNSSYVTTGGGTLTNFYSYFADNPTLTSGTVTNTHGFYGNISSGTGKWNFYAAGTANNYFAGNVGIGTGTFGTSASKVLALGNATAPTTGPADTIQIYSTDLSAGNTMLSLYTEGTPVNANTTAAATHRIAISVNGTVYYLLANTAA